MNVRPFAFLAAKSVAVTVSADGAARLGVSEGVKVMTERAN
ncbi:hypothetical protein SynMINOS11_02670 [Synechococcus sp. Minos11]|nr:hypothetical protein SynMINOS11_02670 [Synechococcus sp. Minos11]